MNNIENEKVYYVCKQNYDYDYYGNEKTYKVEKRTHKWRNSFETESEAIDDYLKAEEIAKSKFKVFMKELNILLANIGNDAQISYLLHAEDDIGVWAETAFYIKINGYNFKFEIKKDFDEEE